MRLQDPLAVVTEKRVRLTHATNGEKLYGLVESAELGRLRVRFFPGDEPEPGMTYNVCVFHGPGDMVFDVMVDCSATSMATMHLTSKVSIKENRQEARVPVARTEVVVKTHDRELDTWMVDMSAGGLAIDAKECLPDGADATLTVVLPSGESHFDAIVRNCMLRPDGEGFRVGLLIVEHRGAGEGEWLKLYKRLMAISAA